MFATALFFHQYHPPVHCNQPNDWCPVVVALLIERSLATPEIRGLNAVIGKILSTNCVIEKTKIKKNSHL